MKVNKIFQHNSYHTLHSGFYKGTIGLAEALKYGSAGIGTLDGANGEVIILDGIAYQGDAHNRVRQVALDETLPYVALLDFAPVYKEKFDRLTSAEFYRQLSEKFSNNLLYGLKARGNFKFVEITSKPANNTESYEEILRKQPHFIRQNVSGTLLGIWGPEHLKSLYGSGFHLHFLSDDKAFGAHLEAFELESLEVEYGPIEQIVQEFDFS